MRKHFLKYNTKRCMIEAWRYASNLEDEQLKKDRWIIFIDREQKNAFYISANMYQSTEHRKECFDFYLKCKNVNI